LNEPTVASLQEDRIRRLEGQVHELADDVARVPALEREVGFLREGFNRNTNTLYQLGVAIFGTGVLGVLTALILKGVIG
jgi:hypothetical protein